MRRDGCGVTHLDTFGVGQFMTVHGAYPKAAVETLRLWPG
jgi:hypothetical protein